MPDPVMNHHGQFYIQSRLVPQWLLFVLLVGGGVGHPLWHSSDSDWGPGNQAEFLKAQVQQLPHTLATRHGQFLWASKGCHTTLVG